MDCTFCLDCVHACPHENIGILARPPGSDLWHDAPRSGVGPLGKRPDLAVLVVVLVFGALANAAGMVGPVLEWRDRLGSLLGQRSPLLVTSLFYFLSLLVLPSLAVGSAAVLSRRWGRLTASWFEVATRYSYALVPLGFSMWLAHYSFHLLTSYDTVVPTTWQSIIPPQPRPRPTSSITQLLSTCPSRAGTRWRFLSAGLWERRGLASSWKPPNPCRPG